LKLFNKKNLKDYGLPGNNNNDIAKVESSFEFGPAPIFDTLQSFAVKKKETIVNPN
jgi:hypothetical protein